MWRRYIRGLLLVVGLAFVFFAAFPFLMIVHFKEPLQTELITSKLLLMPIGAICLAIAILLNRDNVRH